MEAARRFDPDRNVKFITYAVWWIRQAITHALSGQTRAFSLPQKLSAVAARFGREVTELTEQLQRTPTPREIADDLDISEGEVEALIRIGDRDVSLSDHVDRPRRLRGAGARRDAAAGERAARRGSARPSPAARGRPRRPRRARREGTRSHQAALRSRSRRRAAHAAGSRRHCSGSRASASGRSNREPRTSCGDRSAPESFGVTSIELMTRIADLQLQIRAEPSYNSFFSTPVQQSANHHFDVPALRRYGMEACGRGGRPSGRALRLLARRADDAPARGRAHSAALSPVRSRNVRHVSQREAARRRRPGAPVRGRLSGAAQGPVPHRSAGDRQDAPGGRRAAARHSHAEARAGCSTMFAICCA